MNALKVVVISSIVTLGFVLGNFVHNVAVGWKCVMTFVNCNGNFMMTVVVMVVSLRLVYPFVKSNTMGKWGCKFYIYNDRCKRKIAIRGLKGKESSSFGQKSLVARTVSDPPRLNMDTSEVIPFEPRSHSHSCPQIFEDFEREINLYPLTYLQTSDYGLLGEDSDYNQRVSTPLIQDGEGNDDLANISHVEASVFDFSNGKFEFTLVKPNNSISYSDINDGLEMDNFTYNNPSVEISDCYNTLENSNGPQLRRMRSCSHGQLELENTLRPNSLLTISDLSPLSQSSDGFPIQRTRSRSHGEVELRNAIWEKALKYKEEETHYLVSAKGFSFLSKSIGNEWMQFLILLDIPKSRIEQIESYRRGRIDQILLDGLQDWKMNTLLQKISVKSQISQLLEALTEIGHNGLAEELAAKYPISDESNFTNILGNTLSGEH